MKYSVKNILPVLIFISAGIGLKTGYAAAGSAVSESLLKLGKTTYQRECAACHGTEGDGEGPGAYLLNPRPRNFQLGVFKLRSTANGEAPTIDDLFKTITNGIPSSVMPSFKSLSENARWGLVHYLLRLGQLEQENPDKVGIPSAPVVSQKRLDQGRLVYVKLECDSCHGMDGWGDGSSSLTLKNDAKERVFPTNLTTGIFKGGSTPEDIYTRIVTGMDGSPMPSYANKASADDLWSLTHYVMSLSADSRNGQLSSRGNQ